MSHPWELGSDVTPHLKQASMPKVKAVYSYI